MAFFGLFGAPRGHAKAAAEGLFRHIGVPYSGPCLGLTRVLTLQISAFRGWQSPRPHRSPSPLAKTAAKPRRTTKHTEKARPGWLPCRRDGHRLRISRARPSCENPWLRTPHQPRLRLSRSMAQMQMEASMRLQRGGLQTLAELPTPVASPEARAFSTRALHSLPSSRLPGIFRGPHISRC